LLILRKQNTIPVCSRALDNTALKQLITNKPPWGHKNNLSYKGIKQHTKFFGKNGEDFKKLTFWLMLCLHTVYYYSLDRIQIYIKTRGLHMN
jgi:hypothetical protein